MHDRETLQALESIPGPCLREGLTRVQPGAPCVGGRVPGEGAYQGVSFPEQGIGVLRCLLGEEMAEEIHMGWRRLALL
jgi:hypothetical protein